MTRVDLNLLHHAIRHLEDVATLLADVRHLNTEYNHVITILNKLRQEETKGLHENRPKFTLFGHHFNSR